MIVYSEFEFIKDKVFKLLDFETDIQFELIEDEDIFVSYDGKSAKVSGTVKSNTARALTLFVKNMRENKEKFSVKEKKHFDSLGFGLDVSRNAVMRVDSIKEYINILEKYILNKNEPEVSCDAFYSGEELVKMYNMGEGNYDVIFLDMEMNILNGIETANIIRKMDKHVIIVFVTSHNFV